jgi:hypothetical protein
MAINLDPQDLEGLQQTAKEFNLSPEELAEALDFSLAIHAQAEHEDISMEQRFIACVAAISGILLEDTSVETRHARVLQIVQMLDGAVNYRKGSTTVQ